MKKTHKRWSGNISRFLLLCYVSCMIFYRMPSGIVYAASNAVSEEGQQTSNVEQQTEDEKLQAGEEKSRISEGESLSESQDIAPIEDIVIASPANNYTTTSANVSILGACDYRYPLFLNGEKIDTTEHGFFTQYVSLNVGSNEFVFLNHDVTKTITINRKKTATSTGSTSGTSTAKPITYKEYKEETYGVITSNYAMPRKKISESDLTTIPITRGTAVRLLGEDGSYYKIADGTFVAKSSITRYNKAMTPNLITMTKLSYNKERNQMLTELTMNVNAFYHVEIKDQEVSLTLYDTIEAKAIKVSKNEYIKGVTVLTDITKRQVVYTYTLYDSIQVYGYDILFNKGVMKFELKVAPHLTAKGDLTGTTIFLDAGHGDNDHGAIGPLGKYGPAEKDTNLSIMLYAKEYLESLGAHVVVSREDDTFYSLTQRVSMIRNLRPDISVSVHGNSLAQVSNYANASGFLTYYSYQLCGDVPAQINTKVCELLGFNEKPARSKSLSLTRMTTCPAVLLETKFLSNPEDYEYLIQTKNQKAFGQAIGQAVQEYIESIAIYPNVEYCVKKGDTMTKIAARFGLTVDELAKINGITDYNYIEAGQILLVPAK